MEKCAAEAAFSRGSNWRGGGTWCRRNSVHPAKWDSTCSATVTLASSIISSTIWLASLTCRPHAHASTNLVMSRVYKLPTCMALIACHKA